MFHLIGIGIDIGMEWNGMDWIGLGLGLGLDWIGLDWIGLDWIGLDWIGLDWIDISSLVHQSKELVDQEKTGNKLSPYSKLIHNARFA